jgi:hypothetical protein
MGRLRDRCGVSLAIRHVLLIMAARGSPQRSVCGIEARVLDGIAPPEEG